MSKTKDQNENPTIADAVGFLHFTAGADDLEATSPGCDATAGHVQSVVIPQIMADHDATLKELIATRAAAEALAEACKRAITDLELAHGGRDTLTLRGLRASLAQWEEAKK